MALRSLSSLLLLVVVVMVVVQVLLKPAALAQCTAPMDPCATTLDCSGCDATAGGTIPDPEDCHRFYVCQDNVNPPLPLPAICPNDETFDPITLECSATADCFTCPQECVFDCSDPSTPDFISSPNDCNEYYECVGTTANGPMNCDAVTPFFDGETCQTEETRCCRCLPSCTGGQFAVIDPLDCRKYWLCPNADPPTYYGTCDDGEVFDAVLADCSATATCVTACLNVVNTDGCIDPFTCLSTGFFSKCPNLCVNEYYYCEAFSGEYQEPENCLTGTVFHPDDHICVNSSDCPYPEPEYLRVTH